MKTIHKITGILLLFLWSCPQMNFGQTLEEYFQLAADQNPGLAAKYLEFEAALERIDQAKSPSETNISFGYFLSPVETRVGPQRARFSLSQMFPWFGSLKARGDVAALLAESAYQEFLQERNGLFYKVASAYYPIYELEKQSEIHRDNLAILETYKTIANKQFESGRGSMADVLRADLRINATRTRIDLLDEKRKALSTAFNRLLNRPDTIHVTVSDTLLIDTLPALGDSILSGEHPMLEALRLKSLASEVQISAVDKQAMPRFGIGLDYVLVDRRTDLSPSEGAMLDDNGKNALMPMVSMSIPLFASKYTASRREAELMRQTYIKRQEDASNQLLSEHEMVMYELEKNHRYLALYTDQIAETEQVLNLLLSSYSNEGTDFGEILQMQQELLDFELMRINAITEFKIAQARLNYITAKSY